MHKWNHARMKPRNKIKIFDQISIKYLISKILVRIHKKKIVSVHNLKVLLSKIGSEILKYFALRQRGGKNRITVSQYRY